MIILWVLVFVRGIRTQEGATPYGELAHVDELPNVGEFNDGEHRGPKWYEHVESSDTDSDLDSENISFSSSSETESFSSSESSQASSFETKEERKATRVHRTCTPCPHDMLKKRNNIGIKWICGGYQRARRSFKSPCMMRYRNCEDGTLFVKIHDHRCPNDTYHGRHWFYVYRV